MKNIESFDNFSEKIQENNLKEVKLTPEIIKKYKSKENMLIHLREDDDGIALFDNEKLVGYVGFQNNWIGGIWVDKDYRNKNIGSRLIKYAIEHGVTYSSVRNTNKVSLNFHKKNGFVEYDNDKFMTYFKYTR